MRVGYPPATGARADTGVRNRNGCPGWPAVSGAARSGRSWSRLRKGSCSGNIEQNRRPVVRQRHERPFPRLGGVAEGFGAPRQRG